MNFKNEKATHLKIIHLPKEKWKGAILPMRYTATEYYDVILNKNENSFQVDFIKKSFEKPVTHTPEEYDFPDKLYQEYWEGAYAWGIVHNEKLIAAIETCPEEWSNRLLVTELWITESYRRMGIGHKLMSLAKEQARRERRRAVILETQSCNVNAIAFYLKEGFTLIGFDSCCYTNHDIDRKEVRMNLGYFLEKKDKLSREDIIIRKEEPEDWFDTEYMVKRAFWNKYHRGCDEHYLVHKLREDKAYLPELSRIAVKDGKIIGCILYSKAYVQTENEKKEVVTFGPLCVDPNWQGMKVGEMLLKETMQLAAELNYHGIIIFGEPDYYKGIGFKTCDKFGITTADGKNFDVFMGIELIKDGLKGYEGTFHEAEVFHQLTKEEAEEYDKKFPFMEKQSFPGQWD